MAAADFKKLLQTIEKKQYAPFYLVDGEEPFYIDRITEKFEEILTPAERDFNLLTLYGRDVEWAEVVNACRRFPMFAERQVVILKDAAAMKTLNELVGYLENPSPTTVFLIEHRFKKVDGRSKLIKIAKDKGFYFTSEKLKEEQIPVWIRDYGLSEGLRIGQNEAELLAGNLGTDLQKIVNEISKVRINMPDEKDLTIAIIKKFIGISHEYNIFDLPKMLTARNKDKLYPMLSYFAANPKSAPMPLVIATFYSHFARAYQGHFEKVWGGAPNISLPQAERCMLLIADYSAKAVGIDSTTTDGGLLKEMVAKLEMVIG